MARLSEQYNKRIKEELKNKFGLKNIFEVPKLEKIVVNIGVGETVSDSKVINKALEDLSLITGQKPVITKAKKSIAGFKLRKGLNIGCKVTLRKKRMYEFLDRLVFIALPRVRDFKGLSKKSFDGLGNYSIGIKEQIIFPEINYDKIDKVRGMDISIITSTKNQEHAYELLKSFNLPFKVESTLKPPKTPDIDQLRTTKEQIAKTSDTTQLKTDKELDSNSPKQAGKPDESLADKD